MFVLRNPCTADRRDRIIEVGDERAGGVTALEGGGIDEGLEGRSRLALGLGRAIEVAGVEVATANHRPDFTGVRVHRHERRLQRVRIGIGILPALRLALLDVGERAHDFAFRSLLQVQIDRRVNPQSTLVDAFPPEALNELLANFFLEVLTV